jgi:hypothetical protein
MSSPLNLLTARELLRTQEALGHKVFHGERGEYDLNIVGVRSVYRKAGKFDDLYTMFWRRAGSDWKFLSWPCTTDPGHYYLQKLLNPAGCAILAPGQYTGVYALDLHQGKYEALCQRLGPVKVYRDRNKDDTLDMDPGNTDFGRFGINHHHAGAGIRATVGNASAGCQVFQKYDNFIASREIWRAARKTFGNRFTYTLVLEEQLAV